MGQNTYTYLQLVNQVLVRLQEPEVSSVDENDYSRLILDLLNESKNAVEMAGPWPGMRSERSITTASGTAEYEMLSSDEGAEMICVSDEADDVLLTRWNAEEMIRAHRKNPNNSGTARYYAVTGIGDQVNSSSPLRQLQITLYPTPQDARVINFDLFEPADEINSNADQSLVYIRAPTEPVVFRTVAYALQERGEIGGEAFVQAIDKYNQSLARFLALNQQLEAPKAFKVV